jgi:hypothetical protein
MSDLFRRASIPLRLTMVVFIVVSSLSAVFALLILGGYRAVSRAGEAEAFRLISDIVKWSIEDELELAELSLGMITGDETVSALFASRDRDRLYAYLSPSYGKGSRGFISISRTAFLSCAFMSRRDTETISRRSGRWCAGRLSPAARSGASKKGRAASGSAR